MKQRKIIIRSLWSDEQIKTYTKICLDECPYFTPSAIAMKSYYAGNDNKFGETRAVVEKLKQSL